MFVERVAQGDDRLLHSLQVGVQRLVMLETDRLAQVGAVRAILTHLRDTLDLPLLPLDRPITRPYEQSLFIVHWVNDDNLLRAVSLKHFTDLHSLHRRNLFVLASVPLLRLPVPAAQGVAVQLIKAFEDVRSDLLPFWQSKCFEQFLCLCGNFLFFPLLLR